MANKRTSLIVPNATLPYSVGSGLSDRQSGQHGVSNTPSDNWNTVIRATQGNFDHLLGVLRELAAAHNALVADLRQLRDDLEKGNPDPTDP